MKNNKNNTFKFNYPIKYDSVSWDWPWGCYGGIKSWFYSKWESPHKEGYCIWLGIRLLGLKILRVVWTCSKNEAKKHHKIGQEKLMDFLLDLVNEKTNKKSLT